MFTSRKGVYKLRNQSNILYLIINEFFQRIGEDQAHSIPYTVKYPGYVGKYNSKKLTGAEPFCRTSTPIG